MIICMHVGVCTHVWNAQGREGMGRKLDCPFLNQAECQQEAFNTVVRKESVLGHPQRRIERGSNLK